MIPFSESIPDITDPGEYWIPCNDADIDGKITAQQKLSCMAKENEIYVVANMVNYKVVSYKLMVKGVITLTVGRFKILYSLFFFDSAMQRMWSEFLSLQYKRNV